MDFKKHNGVYAPWYYKARKERERQEINNLYSKYQNYLLAFVNTKYGKGYLELEKWAKISDNYPIVKVAPDGIHQLIGWKDKNTPIIRAIFFPASQYIKKFSLALTGIDLASDLIGKIKNPEWLIPHFGGLITPRSWLPFIQYSSPETFYPDETPTSTSVDGRLYNYPANTTWAIVHNATESTAVYSSPESSILIYTYSGGQSNEWNIINRGAFLFDISSIPDSAEIEDTSSYSIYTHGLNNTSSGWTFRLCLTSSNPASDTVLIKDDYDTLGTTEYGTRMAPVEAGYSVFDLNSDGKTFVKNALTDNIVKFGVREQYDLSDTAPSWESAKCLYCNAYFASYESNKPRLIVTYTSGSASPSVSVSATPSISVSLSLSPSPSASISASPSISESATPSISVSVSESATPSVSASVSESATPSVSASVSESATPSVSVSLSPSISESATPSVSASLSTSPSSSASVSESATPSISESATPSISASVSESVTPSISVSLTPSASESATPSISVSVSASASESATPSSSVSASESATPSVSVSLTPSASASVSASLSASVSASVSESLSPSVSVSVSESASPSVSASISVSLSKSPSPSISVSLSPSVSISKSPSVSASVSVSLSSSLSPSPSPSPPIYEDKYTATGNTYKPKYPYTW